MNPVPLAAFGVCATLLGFSTLVEQRVTGKRLELPDVPSRERRRGLFREFRRRFDAGRPTTAVGVAREILAWLFAPALAIRILIHVGAAVVIRGGNPGALDYQLRARSHAVDVDVWTDARLRVATSIYGLFWLLFGTRAIYPAGKVYFGAQIALLIADPLLGTYHWIAKKNMGSSKIDTQSHG